jgi:hypothetical protein
MGIRLYLEYYAISEPSLASRPLDRETEETTNPEIRALVIDNLNFCKPAHQDQYLSTINYV